MTTEAYPMTDVSQAARAEQLRIAFAIVMLAMARRDMFFDPGMGKPPMEFRPGEFAKLKAKMMHFAVTGTML